MKRRPKIAVTGGPSGGKTTLIQFLEKEFSDVVTVVPESASILYGGGFPRKQTTRGRRHAQRSICLIQRELENWSVAEAKGRLIVCDRGSLDSIAYWPGSETTFFESLETSRHRELARYDWIFHLDTANRLHFDTNNPIRIENHREASKLNERVKRAWRGHPQRLIFANTHDFLEKIYNAKAAIEMILAGQTYTEIKQSLNVSN